MLVDPLLRAALLEFFANATCRRGASLRIRLSIERLRLAFVAFVFGSEPPPDVAAIAVPPIAAARTSDEAITAGPRPPLKSRDMGRPPWGKRQEGLRVGRCQAEASSSMRSMLQASTGRARASVAWPSISATVPIPSTT